jgi:hypothetical protein
MLKSSRAIGRVNVELKPNVSETSIIRADDDDDDDDDDRDQGDLLNVWF